LDGDPLETLIKTILVDDDQPVLDMLTQLIPWEDIGFELVGAYNSSFEALQHAELGMPGLIVTDIGMPGMNGIELLKAVRNYSSKTKALILSCHDDFQFAKQAMQLNVSDYILKETLTPPLFIELLIRIKQEIETEQAAEEEHRRMKTVIENNRTLRKQNWIRSFLQMPIINQQEIEDRVSEFGLSLSETSCLPVIGYINRHQAAIHRFVSEDLLMFALGNIIDEILQQQGYGEMFRYEEGRFFLLLPCPDHYYGNQNFGVNAILEKIRRALPSNIKVSVSFLTGESEKDLYGMKGQLQGLLKALEQQLYLAENAVLSLREIEEIKGNSDDLDKYFALASDEFRRAIYEGSEEIHATVVTWMGRIREGRYPPAQVKDWMLNILLDIQMKLKSLQHFQSNFSMEVLHQTISQIQSMEHLEEWLIGFFNDKLVQFKQIHQQSKRVEMAECQKYIAANLGRKLTLEEMAEHLHLNPSYFSRLFKKEMNETFIEYVTRMKMEQAIKWLNGSNNSVEEISERLGFENKSYFLKVFKNFTGKTFNEYRLKGM
jgi:two-component system response regulator YesN